MTKLSLLNKHKDKDPKAIKKHINVNDAYNKLIKSKNVVFFAGAGFSKAWDSRYPTGASLFSITDISTLKSNYNFFKVADDLLIEAPKSSDDEFTQKCYEYFSQIKFHLDIYKRYPSLMPSFLNVTIIDALENEMKIFIKDRFEEMVGKDELNITAKSAASHSFIPFFEGLAKKNGLPSIITTNYDYIFEKILNFVTPDFTLNRGVIDEDKFNKKEWYTEKVNLFKLNGGFEIKRNGSNSYCADYSSTNTPSNIILPSQEQNYTDKYFKTVFVKSAEKLREADLLVFIGYSLPEEDHTIRFLLKNFVDSNSQEKEIIIIGRNISSATEIQNKALLLFPSISSSDGVYALNGSFDDLVKCT